jgi:6-phosphofructokinase 2
MRILTLTMNPCIDQGASVERVEPVRKLRCERLRYEPGGGGINVSRALKTLGGESLALFPAGGADGAWLARLLEQDGIRYRAVDIEGETRRNVHIRDESREEQYRFGMPGPELREAEWRACLDAVATVDPRPDLVVASGSLPPGVPASFFAELADRLAAANIRFAVDTAGEPLRLVSSRRLFLMKPNVRELGTIAGDSLESVDAQAEAARRLARTCRHVVVSRGAAGALVASSDGVEVVEAPEVAVRSAVGAGDSMLAGIVHGLAQGMELVDAARLGVAAGTAASLTPGTELCRREDVERLHDEIRREAQR